MYQGKVAHAIGQQSITPNPSVARPPNARCANRAGCWRSPKSASSPPVLCPQPQMDKAAVHVDGALAASTWTPHQEAASRSFVNLRPRFNHQLHMDRLLKLLLSSLIVGWHPVDRAFSRCAGNAMKGGPFDRTGFSTAARPLANSIRFFQQDAFASLSPGALPERPDVFCPHDCPGHQRIFKGRRSFVRRAYFVHISGSRLSGGLPDFQGVPS